LKSGNHEVCNWDRNRRTNIKYALVGQDGSVFYESLRPTNADTDRDRALNNLKNAAIEIIEFASLNQIKVEWIGIGTPGIIDNGAVLGGAENLPAWENLPLSNLNQELFISGILLIE
jgi:glucokinase